MISTCSSSVRQPIISTATVHPYPLMLYGSFWYAFIPDLTFRGNQTSFSILGGMIYLAALVPSLLIGAGAVRVIRLIAGGYARALRRPRRFKWLLFNATALLIPLMNLLLVLIMGYRSDAWSVFQGRLLFPSYFGLIVLAAACNGWGMGGGGISGSAGFRSCFC